MPPYYVDEGYPAGPGITEPLPERDSMSPAPKYLRGGGQGLELLQPHKVYAYDEIAPLI